MVLEALTVTFERPSFERGFFSRQTAVSVPVSAGSKAEQLAVPFNLPGWCCGKVLRDL